MMRTRLPVSVISPRPRAAIIAWRGSRTCTSPLLDGPCRGRLPGRHGGTRHRQTLAGQAGNRPLALRRGGPVMLGLLDRAHSACAGGLRDCAGVVAVVAAGMVAADRSVAVRLLDCAVAARSAGDTAPAVVARRRMGGRTGRRLRRWCWAAGLAGCRSCRRGSGPLTVAHISPD